MLMLAFKTPTGIPLGTLNMKSLRAYNPGWTYGSSGLSEFGTEQVPSVVRPVATPPSS